MQGLQAALPGVGVDAGVAAVVVKPGAVGGFEAAWAAASWARSRAMQVVFLTDTSASCIHSGKFRSHVSSHDRELAASPLYGHVTDLNPVRYKC